MTLSGCTRVSLRSLEQLHFRLRQAQAADLLVDAVYQGGRNGNASDDPLPHLVGVSNQGGFRYSPRAQCALRPALQDGSRGCVKA
jgi:hypothetical protein